MKITDVKTFVVGNPPPGIGGRYFIFVKLTTDSNVVGYGEAYNATFGPHVTARMIEDLAERYLVGHDPHDIETFFRRAYSSGFSQRPDISVMGCFSALEIACWDIVGKEAGKPVYKLLGGQVHEALRSYTYLYPQTGSAVPAEADNPDKNVYNDPDLAAECALAYVEQGFNAVKLDPAGPYTAFDGHQPRLIDIDLSARMLKAIRAAVGNRADILFGTHGQFTAAGALRMARAIEPYDPLWFEEPVPPDMPEVMAQVARGTSIPIATGERLTTKWEFARIIENRAASILQPDLGRSGGILETKKIAAMAEAYHIQIAPHCYCGPIVGAANIQLATSLPNFLILESLKQWDGFHEKLLKSKIDWQSGNVIPSKEPGLGVELDEAVCEAHPWTGPELHLQMAQDPLFP
ncbi:L-alanine-DL-glutamate epimerase-like enolase superfamily enzyme [Pseudaminobacter salicylatoxidans]|uniref:L-alanine-DL-glutamate epimerase-like enolase superfamily enzyme n=1 Tax=Pseudaminobacter salicylatoxidans TaxID=93369 RepID=A0A316C430_PSESE|nr:mandelate racemase/muconate lactonizing enzyme family protein [Pseudaminobacter salicylatoxidans]PWJ80512.1 L-alanine-DL-glutamate epimerase-like enolase superfamily enzyme [Pseudaminobacter salicylatoxidans]